MQFIDVGQDDYLNLATIVRASFSPDGMFATVTTIAPDYDTDGPDDAPVVVPLRFQLRDEAARSLRYALRQRVTAAD